MPNCVGRRCGPDGCGGQCGFCPTGWSCGPTGACESEDGGCGGIPATGECVSGTAWSCADGVPEREHCAYGACALDPAAGAARCAEVPCLPSCFGRTCGDDGCGGSCGTCPDGETCHPEHELCVPAEGCGPIDEAGTCLAHTLVSCEANELTFEPCLSRGQVCSTDPCDGRPTCHNVWPHTPCCDVPAGGHCAGKHLFTCDGEGWLSIRHCVDDFHRVCIRRDLERHDCFIR